MVQRPYPRTVLSFLHGKLSKIDLIAYNIHVLSGMSFPYWSPLVHPDHLPTWVIGCKPGHRPWSQGHLSMFWEELQGHTYYADPPWQRAIYHFSYDPSPPHNLVRPMLPRSHFSWQWAIRNFCSLFFVHFFYKLKSNLLCNIPCLQRNMCNTCKPTWPTEDPNINTIIAISCVLLSNFHPPAFSSFNHFPDFCVYHTLTFLKITDHNVFLPKHLLISAYFWKYR